MKFEKNDNYPREFHIGEILLIGLNVLRSDAFGFFLLACFAFLPVNIFLQVIPIKEIVKFLIQIFLMNGTVKFNFSELYRPILLVESLSVVFLYYMGVAALALKTNLIIHKNSDANLKILLVIGKKFLRHYKQNLLAMALTAAAVSAWIFTIQFSPVLFLFVSVPMVFLTVNFIFTFYAFGTRDIGILDAMKCSYYLVTGRWGKVFGYTIIISILHFAVGIALQSIRLFDFDGNIIAIVTNTVTAGILSYFTIAYAVLFINFDDTQFDPLQVKSKQVRN